MSVDPRSGFNALRNPALMSMKKRDDLSFLYVYSVLAESETDADVMVMGLTPETEIEMGEDYNGELIFSSVQHSGRHAFGLGLAKGPEGQVYYSSTELSLETGNFSVDHKENRKDFGTNIAFSYSYRLSTKKAVGIQVENSASTMSQTTESFGLSGGAVFEDRRVDAKRNRLTSGLTLGYFYSGKVLEAGTVLKSGRFGFENREYKYKEEVSMSENDEKISNYFMHDEGVGLLGGVNLKLSRILSFAFEGGAAIPYKYTIKECNQDEPALDEYENEVKLDLSYLFKGGMTIRAGSYVTLGAGGSFINYKAEITSDDNLSESVNHVKLLRASAGADVRITEGINFMAGAAYNISDADMTNENEDISMELNIKKKSIEFIGGVSAVY